MKWLISFVFVGLIACASANDNVQELKSWHSAGEKKADYYYMDDYMSYQLPRQLVKLNEDWTFNFFPEESDDEDIACINFNDSKWSTISIPPLYQNYETTYPKNPSIMNASEETKTFFRTKGRKGHMKYWGDITVRILP